MSLKIVLWVSEVHFSSTSTVCLQCHKQLRFFSVYTVCTADGKNDSTVSCLTAHSWISSDLPVHISRVGWVIACAFQVSGINTWQQHRATLCSDCFSVIVVTVAFKTVCFLYVPKHRCDCSELHVIQKESIALAVALTSKRFTWVVVSCEDGGGLVNLHGQTKAALVGGAVSHHKCPCFLVLHQGLS